MHMAATANLVAHYRQTLLAADTQTVIVGNNGRWYFTAQLHGFGLGLLIQRFAKLQDLELQ